MEKDSDLSCLWEPWGLSSEGWQTYISLINTSVNFDPQDLDGIVKIRSVNYFVIDPLQYVSD